jgi:hypothetical protein
VTTSAEREIPELQGWLALPVAAERVGLSRQWLHDMVTAPDPSGELRNVRRVRGTGTRPVTILVRTAEVERLKKARELAQGCPQCRRDTELARASGQEVDVARLVCGHGAAETPDDPELEEALGL